MATTSYPAVGNGGLTATDWGSMYTCPDGVVNDLVGGSLALTRINTGNIARIAAGTACVNGYFLENDSDLDLTVPTAAGTYRIAVMYDPTLNVADNNGDASPEGPCRIIIATGLDTSGGKAYTHLHTIIRTAGQTLTAATHNDYRQHIGPNLSITFLPQALRNVPESNFGGYTHPIGTTIHERSTGEVWRKVPSATGNTAFWQPSSISTVVNIPMPAALVTANTGEAPRYWLTDNNMVCHLEGTIKRSNNTSLTNGADVGLGTMPADVRPEKQVRFACTAKKPSKWTTVNVTVRTDGIISLYDPTDEEVDWVDLSGIHYRLKDR